MTTPVIEVRQLGKRYRIGGGGRAYRTLRDSLMGLFWRGESARTNAAKSEDDNTFWALQDLSFDVKQGEVLGVVGHNGAGKTTLLRLLSRITEPSVGCFRIRGRVGSLLEVGTGFHPELTGRENTYLSGAILGMSSREIAAKFDEIVDFAGVERFIDTPVKHFSSGMYLRLAFAVAAHLEPEVLLVDEVLAVGDAAFQKKCLGKMQNVAGQGRTVLFVSHNLAAVANLCGRCLWLAGGKLANCGETGDVIAAYVKSTQSGDMAELLHREDRRGSGQFQFQRLWLSDSQGQVVDVVPSGAPLQIHLSYRVPPNARAENIIAALVVRDLSGGLLFTLSTHLSHPETLHAEGEGVIVCHVPRLPLVAGSYSLGLWSSVSGELADEITEATQFTVCEADVFATGKVPRRNLHGPFVVEHSWTVSDSPPTVTSSTQQESSVTG